MLLLLLRNLRSNIRRVDNLVEILYENDALQLRCIQYIDELL